MLPGTWGSPATRVVGRAARTQSQKETRIAPRAPVPASLSHRLGLGSVGIAGQHHPRGPPGTGQPRSQHAHCLSQPQLGLHTGPRISSFLAPPRPARAVWLKQTKIAGEVFTQVSLCRELPLRQTRGARTREHRALGVWRAARSTVMVVAIVQGRSCPEVCRWRLWTLSVPTASWFLQFHALPSAQSSWNPEAPGPGKSCLGNCRRKFKFSSFGAS